MRRRRIGRPSSLLVGRVLQGLGPAMLVPGSLAVVRALFPDERQRATAIGLWPTSSGLALAVGPVLGGLVVEGLGWRWVFLLNVPLTLVLLALAARCLPKLPRTREHAFDAAGAILTIACVASLAFATIEGQRRGWSSPTVWAMFLVGGALL